jgi:hypothetical protein
MNCEEQWLGAVQFHCRVGTSMSTTAQGGRLKTQSNQGARQLCAPHSAVVQQCGRLGVQLLSGPTDEVLPDLVTSVCAALCACHNVGAFDLRYSASVWLTLFRI